MSISSERPLLGLTARHLEPLQTELATYLDQFASVWQRREQKENGNLYLRGLLATLPNKSVETMMLHLQGADPGAIRNMQHFLSKGSWQDEEVLRIHWREVAQTLGDENGVLIIDDSGFPKQGNDSVGVKRQWCGQLGKRANCQVGVFLAYAVNSHPKMSQGQSVRMYQPESPKLYHPTSAGMSHPAAS